MLALHSLTHKPPNDQETSMHPLPVYGYCCTSPDSYCETVVVGINIDHEALDYFNKHYYDLYYRANYGTDDIFTKHTSHTCAFVIYLTCIVHYFLQSYL